MELKDIDLNLLVVFNQLLIDRRVSIVAEKLGQTQPAISNALNRLRRLLGDELFLRTSKGMEPTSLSIQLAEPIAYALSAIHSTLNQQALFDPERTNRTFTIGMTDIGEIYFLPRLMDALSSIAPNISINTVRNTTLNLKEGMESGHVDLAVGLLPQLKAGFFQQRLFEQKYVCLMRRGHPLDKRKISVEEFSQADHVKVVASGTGHARVDEAIERKGIRRNVRLTVPHFVAVGHILSTTDMIATVPERYARQCLEPFNLRFLQHPVELPETGINCFWHAKFHKEPGNQWMRRLVFKLFSDKKLKTEMLEE
ncbi:LysR family transcriptional regulator [Herbaspirillum rubrisubalbicans]|uniref:LysR family transcriptional regulator n=2 Tax=Herbaspirillum rubrisubalbicans TaxID=80842 RepID=A0ABX9BWG7_9BURK|nr:MULTISPECIES: LysR family transcriptional regulator [Herbaspirillum]MCP1576186.1 DNA-binding transcriptional LysR family regulator [Herbaspirillum rubrisubalbicans]NQE48932.1 LysR family transcriptional regulator [Herbaspirillum rubrisubalbicans]QJP99436.1 LysR family transcriptional regulator [Herbaspirillum rubrisubalbicans Os34]RAM62220.1 LysR family transcriptional regulator [Herbaspirillum rubrisubalbicans]RAN50053.1 LysR family transcriptional regulator [Herbaspirillum rubrisubalbican